MLVNPDECGFLPLIGFVTSEEDFDKKGVDELCKLDGKELEKAGGDLVRRNSV